MSRICKAYSSDWKFNEKDKILLVSWQSCELGLDSVDFFGCQKYYSAVICLATFFTGM
ncbi:hypothetical protein SAMN04488502_102115 [Dendrosporobacter quercicolus]|uniref:Uncharacterized protein n=1 Tax=Dendrosporobacter quercicolus TaxID=146817 RepID=A0A1G9QBU6_9FIRM|nr:hypothetical protein SAMN04488502_102115 [Dendrosporobacter quercicolus]